MKMRMPRVYKRKFDWDEAKRRHAAGESYSSIARAFGVSGAAIRRVVDENAYRYDRENVAAWQASGTCPDCGTQSTRRAAGVSSRCTHCSAIAKATSVREDTLQCVTCKAWKPDEDFPHNREEWLARRGRHSQCRPCQTRARRDHRRRNREQENAYGRAYKARRRAEQRAKTAGTR
jgi:hypothetical protein